MKRQNRKEQSNEREDEKALNTHLLAILKELLVQSIWTIYLKTQKRAEKVLLIVIDKYIGNWLSIISSDDRPAKAFGKAIQN